MREKGRKTAVKRKKSPLKERGKSDLSIGKAPCFGLAAAERGVALNNLERGCAVAVHGKIQLKLNKLSCGIDGRSNR